MYMRREFFQLFTSLPLSNSAYFVTNVVSYATLCRHHHFYGHFHMVSLKVCKEVPEWHFSGQMQCL